MQVHEVARARACYERALEAMGDDANTVRVCSYSGDMGAVGVIGVCMLATASGVSLVG